MSLYKQFKTDPVLEQDGILIDYQDFRLRLRRAGGSNKRYLVAFQKAMKPWRHKDIDKEDPNVRRDLLINVFVEACYVEHSWETKINGEYQKGVEDELGNLLPGSIANVLKMFRDLPDLARTLSSEAEEINHYLASATEAAAENLAPSSSGS